MPTRKRQGYCCVGTILPFSHGMGIGTVLQQYVGDGLISEGRGEHERGDSSSHRINQCRILLQKDNIRDCSSFWAIHLIWISTMGKKESHPILILRKR